MGQRGDKFASPLPAVVEVRLAFSALTAAAQPRILGDVVVTLVEPLILPKLRIALFLRPRKRPRGAAVSLSSGLLAPRRLIHNLPDTWNARNSCATFIGGFCHS